MVSESPAPLTFAFRSPMLHWRMPLGVRSNLKAVAMETMAADLIVRALVDHQTLFDELLTPFSYKKGETGRLLWPTAITEDMLHLTYAQRLRS